LEFGKYLVADHRDALIEPVKDRSKIEDDVLNPKVVQPVGTSGNVFWAASQNSAIKVG
jgi:hypothetical protein